MGWCAQDGTFCIFACSFCASAALNENLFAKARGAKPGQTATTPISLPIGKDLKAPRWLLAAWLARIRRCLAARLFLESSEAAALDLAVTSHTEWLKDAAECNYMQLQLRGEGTSLKTEALEASGERSHECRPKLEALEQKGVHPLNVWSEPRAPSPGRALLCSLYTALGQSHAVKAICLKCTIIFAHGKLIGSTAGSAVGSVYCRFLMRGLMETQPIPQQDITVERSSRLR